jgi:hypothetical protein
MTNPFRSVSNQRLLKGLFYEESDNQQSVVYTLKDRDHPVGDKTFPSLYRLYMETDDLTEWDFATKYLDGWEHWQMLCNCTWFQPFVARWRQELEVRARSRSLLRLRAVASSSAKEAYLANKFLIERGWVPKDEKSSVGRPTKEAIKREAEQLFQNSKEAETDLARITKELN